MKNAQTLKVTFFAAVLSLLAGPVGAVLHGEPVPITEHVAVAHFSLLTKDNDTTTCTGVFVSDSTMITATHCVKDAKKVILQSFGNGRLQKRPAMVKFISHPGYEPALQSKSPDISVIIFPAGTSASHVEIDPVRDFSEIYNDEGVLIVGFGFSKFPYKEDPGYRDFTKLTKNKGILYPTTFHPKWDGKNKSDSVLCFLLDALKNKKTVPMPGDSGSPIFYKGKVVGILSGSRFDPKSKSDGTIEAGNDTNGAVFWLLDSKTMAPLWKEAIEKGATGLNKLL